MKKTIAILVITILSLKALFGQITDTPLFDKVGVAYGSYGYYDVTRMLSQTYAAGTARMQGIGGAQISLGGDLSAAHFNPAGLGLYNRSSFTFTPSLDFHSTTAEYEGQFTEDYKANFNFAHLGAGFHHDGYGAYKGGTFAITLTRINDFYNDTFYGGVTGAVSGKSTSIIDSYREHAVGFYKDDLVNADNDAYNSLGLAYGQYLINPEYDREGLQTGNYWNFIGGVPVHEERVITRGKQYQWDFSYGGNYNDRLYFGVGIGISTMNYREERIYDEYDFQEELFDNSGEPTGQWVSEGILDYLSTRSVIDMQGVGGNATFGVIARPVDALRIGFSAKTPTFFNIEETSSLDLMTQYFNYQYVDSYYPEDDAELDYFYEELEPTLTNINLRTPWKLSTGVSVFLGKSGFLSADIDYLNYSNSKLKAYDFNVSADNSTIRNLYASTFNYRIGGEFKAGPIQLRAGYGVIGDPYKNGSIDRSIQRISGGLGFRNQDFYLDASVVHSRFDSELVPFTFPDGTGPSATVENKNTNVSVTVGFNF
ncbi:OmpP1/FadL family transporter [Reichenbachiella versicolor]|uniref:OmpP1/FadL family transporter n=1 Tax=Reichenbachiella versicolor TaxID=1821036 RepID=UPI000D6DD390|nr:hypothetical protein [Reichenbachiella versicolor]